VCPGRAVAPAYLIEPIGLFIAAGIFMSACAVASLLFGSARDYCNQRAAF
jgi:hypothetical protein